MDITDRIKKMKKTDNLVEVSNFLKQQIYKIQYETSHLYKNKNMFDSLLALSELLYFCKTNIINDSPYFKLLILINKCMHGQKILNKYNYIIHKLSNETIINICILSCDSWTFPIFQYYMNILINRNINTVYERIFIDAFSNTDDRIYQNIISNYYYKTYFNFNFEQATVINFIYSICSPSIPNKYILRRLRYLNMIVPKLYNYFPSIFNILCNKSNITIIPSIMKYYYVDSFLTPNEIELFVETIISPTPDGMNSFDIKHLYLNMYDYVKTQDEKNLLITNMILYHGSAYGNKIIDGNNFLNKYQSNIERILSFVLDVYNPITYINTTEFYTFINSFNMDDISKCINLNNNKLLNKLMFLLPYVILSTGTYYKQFNIVRYQIYKFIKNIRNKKQIISKIKLYPVLNELKNLKSTSSKPVLSSSSYLYSQIKQKFNTIPPYHLFPGQLQNMDEKKHFLLKEKADGVLVNSMPKDIYPNNPFTNNLKIEYIEDMDLYLVFDIDINNSIYDRHLHIHGCHKYGQKNIPIINNLDEMIECINNERKKIQEFLLESYDNYRWYPKPAWYINNISNFIEPLTDLVNMKNSIDEWITVKNICPSDGLILTPLDGSREIKIKPKKLYSIDLLYIDNKWIDRDNIEWTVESEGDLINNTIWRCYYDDNNIIAKEIRHDKTKPNSNQIATLITSLYKTEYKYNKYDFIYHNYSTNNTLNEWNSIIKTNNTIIKKMFNKITTLRNNANIIDFGCGSGRSLLHLNNYIKDYTYIGLDKDVNMICKAINKYSISDKIMFSYSDINNSEFDWIKLNEGYYDIVLMINSLMHFSTNEFWDRLKLINKPSTLLLFNLVSMENNECYKFNDCFMERKDDKVYYKFAIHDNIKEEPYIDINDILNKGYNIVECYQPNTNDLTKYYKWYILSVKI